MSTAQYAEHDWYDTPFYYDIIFAADTELECDFMEGAFARHARGSLKRVLEPACGSGRLVEAMARRGFDVCGFDLSAPMLDYTRRRLETAGLQAKVREGNMAHFSVGRGYDLAHCLVSTFKYLLTEKDARSHLQGVADSLRVGGIYVLGFHLSDYDDMACSRERWFGERQGTQVLCNIQSWPADRRRRVEQLRSRLLIKERRKQMKLETHWEFRSYNAAQARRMLRAVPSLEHVATYDFTYNLDLPRPFNDDQLDCVLILRKRSLRST